MELTLYLVALMMMFGLILKRYNLKDFFKEMNSQLGLRNIPGNTKTTPVCVRVTNKNPNPYTKL